ncbi:MAG: DUF438 domain-containing protein [Candidatus Krumholzibacteriia bacterium]
MSELIDNSRQRVETLKEVIRGLHEGADPAVVKQRLKDLVQATTSEEIVAMEAQLMEEGMTVEEIKAMCDLHSQVTAELLGDRLETTTAGHPHDSFRRENEAIAAAADRMQQVLDELDEMPAERADRDLEPLLDRWRRTLEDLLEVEKHYARKENLLFAYLERHGVTGPSKVMWGKDDDIRAMLRALREALTEQDAGADEWRLVAQQVARPLLDQIREMIHKEERILLPLSLRKLTPAQWGAIHVQSPRFGWCLVEPGTDYTPPPETEAELTRTAAETAGDPAAGSGEQDGTSGAAGDAAAGDAAAGDAAAAAAFSGAAAAAPAAHVPLRVGVGTLTLAQLRGLVRVLPVDLTFVDADDRVVFFSEGDRVFERPPAIIGRQVQNCHPPASVDTVERILDDFKAGRESAAEFWIELRGRFVHIRYFAVRDDGGGYLGTLEVTQDLTPLRALAGERRLLQYDEEPHG